MEDIILKDTEGNKIDLNEAIHDYIRTNLTVDVVIAPEWCKVKLYLSGQLISESEDSY